MTTLGLLLRLVGTAVNTGVMQLTFSVPGMADGIEIVALGLFGIAEFIKSVNAIEPINAAYTNIRLRTCARAAPSCGKRRSR